MKKTQFRSRPSFYAIAILFGATVAFAPFSGNEDFLEAQSVNDLRNQSAQIQRDIESSNSEANRLQGEANTLRVAISSLDNQIAAATKQIDETNAKINQLQVDLENTQAELERQKELLRANIRALYKRGDASTVELIVGSDNFSKFIDEQEYLERIKAGVQDSTNKVIALKAQIESQKAEQVELQKQQEAARASIADARSQRANILAQTEGEEARFRAIVDSLQSKRQDVEKQLAAKILAGSFASLGSVGQGQPIGRVGMTGFTFGPHLHFEIRNSGFRPMNPNGVGAWPLPNYEGNITQQYGCSSIRYALTQPGCPSSAPYLHAGLDIGAPIGAPIVAARSGQIIHRGDQGDGYGIKVIIKHDDGTYSLYAHLSP